MADIAMCRGTHCPLKEKCWRYNAPADIYQHYISEVPYDFKNQCCSEYWERDLKGKRVGINTRLRREDENDN